MRVRVILLSMAVLLSSAAVAKNAKELTADEIVARNAQARGGVEAWRHLQTMIWTGQLESDSAPMPTMAFALEQKRPNKTRFEITGSGSRTMRIYDGAHGYRVAQAPPKADLTSGPTRRRS